MNSKEITQMQCRFSLLQGVAEKIERETEMEMTSDLLKAVCFAILMENDEGIMNKHPSYVCEKFQTACPEILDESNKRKLIGWARAWGVELKEIETIIPLG